MAKHVIPQRIYFLVFVTLILLTLITVDLAFYDAGWLNLYIALTIATCKALLVILYFMHLRYSSRLTWIFVGTGLFWLVMMVGLTMGDFFTRGWEAIPQGWTSFIFPIGDYN
jgi:cytochrome c oxidase subunit IV